MIIAEIQQLIKDYKPFGQITVRLTLQKDSGGNYHTEINLRFGGGATLTIKACADCAEMMLQHLNREKIGYQAHVAEDGAVFSRFDQSVRVK